MPVLPQQQAYARKSGEEVQRMEKVPSLGAGANPRLVESQPGRAYGQEKSEDIFCRFSQVPHYILPEVIPLGKHELGQEVIAGAQRHTRGAWWGG